MNEVKISRVREGATIPQDEPLKSRNEMVILIGEGTTMDCNRTS